LRFRPFVNAGVRRMDRVGAAAARLDRPQRILLVRADVHDRTRPYVSMGLLHKIARRESNEMRLSPTRVHSRRLDPVARRREDAQVRCLSNQAMVLSPSPRALAQTLRSRLLERSTRAEASGAGCARRNAARFESRKMPFIRQPGLLARERSHRSWRKSPLDRRDISPTAQLAARNHARPR
jgi:hypothetical protein